MRITTMVELFRDFWWLLFPLSWIIYAGFRGYLHAQRRADAIRLVKVYKEKGQEPPAELLQAAFGPGC
jgi:hypothetical protein